MKEEFRVQVINYNCKTIKDKWFETEIQAMDFAKEFVGSDSDFVRKGVNYGYTGKIGIAWVITPKQSR